MAEVQKASLNPKQERFIKEYLRDLNATQAYIRAGYSPKGAEASACKLLRNPKVRARVDIEIAKASARTGVTPDRVLRELARIAFANLDNVIDLKTGAMRPSATKEDKAAVTMARIKRKKYEDEEETELEVRMGEKTKALEVLAKHLGMMTERISFDEGAKVLVVDFSEAASE